MTSLLLGAALLVGALAVVAAGVVLAARRDARPAASVLLQLLLAAGLLGLSAAPTWRALVVVAVVVGLRCLLVVGLGRSARNV